MFLGGCRPARLAGYGIDCDDLQEHDCEVRCRWFCILLLIGCGQRANEPQERNPEANAVEPDEQSKKLATIEVPGSNQLWPMPGKSLKELDRAIANLRGSETRTFTYLATTER